MEWIHVDGHNDVRLYWIDQERPWGELERGFGEELMRDWFILRLQAELLMPSGPQQYFLQFRNWMLIPLEPTSSTF